MKKIIIETIDNITVNKALCEKIFKNEKSLISLKAWSLLNTELIKENIDLMNEHIVYNTNGKPYLSNKNIYFNISHSDTVIAIIISDQECGIDIEFVDYNKNHDKYIHKILSKNEIDMYNNSDDKIKYFYKQWTKKEAYMKYNGTGIQISKLNNELEQSNIITEEITKNGKKYIFSYL